MTYQRVPPVPSGYSNAYLILQSPGQVVILNEMIHDVRVVPLDGRPPIDRRIRQWNGDGRGRWEGDTLVVETTLYRDDTTWRGFPGTRNLRAVERFHAARRRHDRLPLHDSRRRHLHPTLHGRVAAQRVRRATSSTSTRVTKGTTRSTTRWPASGPWRQPPGSPHAGSNPAHQETEGAPGARSSPCVPASSRIRHCRKERTA